MITLTHVPETPIVEELAWATDVQTADNGNEVRICLRDEPKRTLNLKYVFDNEDDLRRTRAVAMAALDRPFQLPFFHHATRLTANAAAGAAALALAPAKAELRPGRPALLFDRSGRLEPVTVLAVQPAGVTLTAPLAGAWKRGASIAPVWPVIGGSNATFTRMPLAGASASLTVTDADFMVPFLNPANVTVLQTFSGLPLLPFNAVGDSFDEGFSNGSSVVDYGGVPYMRSPWSHQQLMLTRTFLCNRVFDRPRWQWWNALFDYMKGSQKPVYMPTFREDFKPLVRPAGGGNSVTFEGTEYADDFFPFAPFKQFAFFAGAGVHYAAVTACAKVGGNSVVTFAPALPAGAGWQDEQLVSLLLKVRVADDKVSCEHTSLQTRVTLNLRTVND